MIDLSIGEPKKKFKYFSDCFLRKNIRCLNKYPSSLGNKVCLESINNWIKKRNKISKNLLKNIIISIGNRESIFSIIYYLNKKINKKNKRNIIITPDPYYKNYLSGEMFMGNKNYYLNSNSKKEFIKNFNNIKTSVFKKTLIMLVCSPNNPSGYILKKKDWKLLYNKARKHKFYILSDECYSEIYFEKPISSIKFFIKKKFNRFFAINSLSKTSSVPGLRSGFIFSNYKDIKNLENLKTFSGNALGDFGQKISSKLWGDFDRIKKIRKRYQTIINSCYKIFRKNIKLKKPKGGFYLWFNVKNCGLTANEFCVKLENKEKIRLFSSSSFSKKLKYNVRIALVESKKKCVYASKRIVKFYNENKERNKKNLENKERKKKKNRII